MIFPLVFWTIKEVIFQMHQQHVLEALQPNGLHPRLLGNVHLRSFKNNENPFLTRSRQSISQKCHLEVLRPSSRFQRYNSTADINAQKKIGVICCRLKNATGSQPTLPFSSPCPQVGFCDPSTKKPGMEWGSLDGESRGYLLAVDVLDELKRCWQRCQCQGLGAL